MVHELHFCEKAGRELVIRVRDYKNNSILLAEIKNKFGDLPTDIY